MNRLLFFSSDRRDLYREDIYRAICLPNGYVIHFRYQRKYVDNALLTDTAKIKGLDGTIFFTIGNKLDGGETATQLKNVSIRNVTVEQYLESQETDLVHFYLKLKDFSNLKVDSNNATEKLPPFKFVSQLDVSNISNNGLRAWWETVDAVKSSFPQQNFVSLALEKDDARVEPEFDAATRESYYHLNSETSYVLDLAYYRCDDDKDRLAIVTGDGLSTDTSGKERLGNVRDNRRFGLRTKEVTSTEQKSYVEVNPSLPEKNGGQEPFNILLRFRIERSMGRSVVFGLLAAALALLATFKFFKEDRFAITMESNLAWLVLAVGFAGVAFILGYFHWQYNKK